VAGRSLGEQGNDMKPLMSLMMAVCCLAAVGCATKRPPKPFQLLAGEYVPPVKITKPIDAKSAALGITVMKSDRWGPGSENRLYLVKVETDRDLYQGTKLIPTSLSVPAPGSGGGGTVYVQNIPPGRYAAVAYSESVRGYGKTRELTIYLFGEELIKRTDTTVSAGSIGFMGKYELGPDTMILKAATVEPAQEHYFEVLWGKSLIQVMEDLRIMGTPAYFPVHTISTFKASRDIAAEQEFLATAKREFDPGWAPVIDQRRISLK
jgi:hypothetical protein